MEEMGCKECKVTNGDFTHPERDLRAVVHVDDFLLSGESHQLQWFRDHFAKKYELKVEVAGWAHGDSRGLQFLGRAIRLTQTGIELEGDDKHVEMMEKEWDMAHSNPVATPYVKLDATVTGAQVEATNLNSADATFYRRAAARINYSALDRPDLSFASRVASSHMSCPKEGDYQLIKRIIRYLKGKPRVAIRYKFQDASEGITVFTDSDWAGDEATRRSTSGGVVCRGQHTHH
jgi:hypothetical protein